MARVFRRDARDLGTWKSRPFHLLFVDAPYDSDLGKDAIVSAAAGGWLEENAIAFLEQRTDRAFEPTAEWTILKNRTYGDTRLLVLRRERVDLIRHRDPDQDRPTTQERTCTD